MITNIFRQINIIIQCIKKVFKKLMLFVYMNFSNYVRTCLPTNTCLNKINFKIDSKYNRNECLEFR